MGVIVARADELACGRRFLAADDGLRALLVDGPAGMGKTTVWQELVREAEAAGMRVLSCRPVAAEATYAFASLADLLAPVADEQLASLPEPQWAALQVALLRLSPSETPVSPRAVGAGTLSMLERCARRQRVLLAVDDVQWLDTASAAALRFALRRLDDERVSVLAAVRSGATDQLDLVASLGARVERLSVGPLSLSALYHLVAERLGRPLARPTLQRVARASGGNPLFALELAQALVERDAVPGPGDPLPVPESLSELMAGRIARLPRAARRVALGAALLTSPRLAVLGRAFGSTLDGALTAGKRAGVVSLEDDRVRFSHPLLAAAVLADATPEEVRALHATLADLVEEPEERARHLALAAVGPDEAVAVALEEAARKVDATGAPEVAAELAELACRTTPEGAVDDRARRELALAEYAFRAGDTERALEVADRLHGALPAGSLRAAVCELLVHLSYVARTDVDAVRFAEQALAECAGDAQTVARLHVTLARVSYADAEAGARSLRMGLELLGQIDDPDPSVLGQALTARIGSEIWSREELPVNDVEHALELERIAPASYVADRASASLGVWLRAFGDLDAARTWLERTHRAALDEGDESSLPYALGQLAQVELAAGAWARAEQLAQEHLSAAAAAAQPDHRRQALFNLAAVHAHAGRIDEARTEAVEVLRESEALDDLWMATNALAVLGFVELSVGDPAAAVSFFERGLALCRAVHRRDPLRAYADHVEALVELGDHARASEIAELLLELTRPPSPSPTRAVAERAAALAAAGRRDLEAASAALQRAVDLHQQAVVPFDLARTLNVAGQVHRRRGERRAARDAFDRARTILEGLGARVWVGRVEAEARRVPIRRGAGADLTPTELQVAELVAEGRTTREVAQALFVSPKTVEANLTRIYRKLGIRSRAELGRAMAVRAKT